MKKKKKKMKSPNTRVAVFIRMYERHLKRVRECNQFDNSWPEQFLRTRTRRQVTEGIHFYNNDSAPVFVSRITLNANDLTPSFPNFMCTHARSIVIIVVSFFVQRPSGLLYWNSSKKNHSRSNIIVLTIFEHIFHSVT